MCLEACGRPSLRARAANACRECHGARAEQGHGAHVPHPPAGAAGRHGARDSGDARHQTPDPEGGRLAEVARLRGACFRAVRALLRDARERGWVDYAPTVGVVVRQREQDIRPWLRDGELQLFLAAAAPSWQIRAGLIAETGLRVGEAVVLRWDWITFGRWVGRGWSRIPRYDQATGWACKGRRARSIPLSREATRLLLEAKRKWGRDGYVLHARKTPIRTDNWHRDTTRACEKAGVRRLDPHGLRRTAGARWLAAGIDLFTVSLWLGHADIKTTQACYAGVAESTMSAKMDRRDERAPRRPKHDEDEDE